MTGFKRFRAVIMMCAALGWWGIWFPELAVWADTVCVVEEEYSENTVQQREKMIEYDAAWEIIEGLKQADREQIQVKSRLLQLIEQYLQKK